MRVSMSSFARWLQRALAAWAVISVAIATFDIAFGRFSFDWLGIRISSWEAYKPLRNGLISASLALWLHDWDAEAVSSWNWIARWSRLFAAGAAIASCLIAFRYGIFAAGGADGYGYVSQAALWASGTLTPPEPLAPLYPMLGPSIAPLGYRTTTPTGPIVPTYAVGLPIVMALASRIGGPPAVYVVVPIFGALAVWLTYLLAERLVGPRTGLVASILVSCSPTFVLQTLEPMSDVPATTCWLAAWLMVITEGRATPLLAGLAASAAVLIRPNLVPLAVVVGAAAILSRPRLSRGACFALGLAPGCLAVAAINQWFYGTPLSSGYGALDTLFKWNRLGPNLRHYPVWLVQLHTLGILLALLAPAVIRREPDARPANINARAVAGLMLLFSAALLICYLFWIPFDGWPFLRFLLPAIPLLFILSSAVVVTVVNRAPVAHRTASVFVLCILLASWYLVKAHSLDVFDTASSEHRYVAVGRFVGQSMPPNAALLSVIESGSVRLYGNRPTIRWDMLTPDGLDPALKSLRAAGYAPYILLESWEEDLFRTRFRNASVFGDIDWPPAIQYRGTVDVRIYSPDDRAAFLAGQRIVTQLVPSS